MPVVPAVWCIVLVAVGLFFFCLIRYVGIKQKYGGPVSLDARVQALPDMDGVMERFARMIRMPTVSWTDRSKRDLKVFGEFQALLETMYPLVHQHLTRRIIGPFGIIYHWKGKNDQKKPVLFLAHYDVVPAEDKGDEAWQEDPFAGVVKDGVLWGRGTLDIKCQLMFQMETAEFLLSQGWQPDQDIYFAFGGDEEVAGKEGAAQMAALFRSQGIEFEFVLDEGGIIARDQLAFLKGKPAGLVGLAEKGFVTFNIQAAAESGHSSMPDKKGTAIGHLAQGVVRMEKSPFGARLDPVMKNMLERFVPHVSFGLGLIFSNLWLTRPLILYIFSKNKVTDSLIRTTQAVTVFKSGEQENILPSEAWCKVNHRILPGDTIESIRRRHETTLSGMDLRIQVSESWPSNDPVPAGEVDAPAFNLIRKVLVSTHPHAIAAPFLVNASTDSKYYADLTAQVLRFCPLALTPADVAGIHGVNEKVSIENIEKGLKFYIELFYHL